MESITNRKQSFVVDDRVTLKLDPALAADIGQLILGTRPINPAIVALAHQLSKVIDD